MKKGIVSLGILVVISGSYSFSRDRRSSSTPIPSLLAAPRPTKETKVHNIGDLWSMVSNFGNYGDPNSDFPSYDWPGGTRNYYLWEGRFWFGAMVGGVPRVSHADYGNYELSPSDGSSIISGKGTSMWDITTQFDDYDPSSNIDPLGVKVIQKAFAWSVPTYDDFIAYEYKLINMGMYLKMYIFF